MGRRENTVGRPVIIQGFVSSNWTASAGRRSCSTRSGLPVHVVPSNASKACTRKWSGVRPATYNNADESRSLGLARFFFVRAIPQCRKLAAESLALSVLLLLLWPVARRIERHCPFGLFDFQRLAVHVVEHVVKTWLVGGQEYVAFHRANTVCVFGAANQGTAVIHSGPCKGIVAAGSARRGKPSGDCRGSTDADQCRPGQQWGEHNQKHRSHGENRDKPPTLGNKGNAPPTFRKKRPAGRSSTTPPATTARQRHTRSLMPMSPGLRRATRRR